METKTDSGAPLIEKPSESPGQSPGILWSIWNWLTTKRALTNAQVTSVKGTGSINEAHD